MFEVKWVCRHSLWVYVWVRGRGVGGLGVGGRGCGCEKECSFHFHDEWSQCLPFDVKLLPYTIGSLTNHDGDAEDNVNWKWTYILPTNPTISLSHLVCFSLSKRSRDWIWNAAVNSWNKFKKLSLIVQVLQTTQNLVISRRCYFAEDGKETYARASPLPLPSWFSYKLPVYCTVARKQILSCLFTSALRLPFAAYLEHVSRRTTLIHNLGISENQKSYKFPTNTIFFSGHSRS